MQELKPIKEGKVREIYDNGDSLIMVATDRISCFDVILNNEGITTGGPDDIDFSEPLAWQRNGCTEGRKSLFQLIDHADRAIDGIHRLLDGVETAVEDARQSP